MLDLAPISVLVRGPALEQEDQQRIAVLLHHAHAFTTLVDRLARALDRTPVGFLLQVLGRLDLGGPEVRLEALVPRPPLVDPLARDTHDSASMADVARVAKVLQEVLFMLYGLSPCGHRSPGRRQQKSGRQLAPSKGRIGGRSNGPFGPWAARQRLFG